MAATESHFVDVTRRHEYEHKTERKEKHRSGEYGEKKGAFVRSWANEYTTQRLRERREEREGKWL